MPDRDTVIEALQYLISGECTDTQFDYLDEIEAAIVLLKEQEPKKIIRKQMSYEHPDGAITYYAEWQCPHCNKVVKKGFDSPWLKYCFNCGKPILWD